MSSRYTVVETSLNRAEFRWKWLRFIQHTFVLGALLCLVVLVLAGAILAEWVTSKSLVTLLLVLLGVGGFVAWAVVVIKLLADAPERKWLAAALERVDRRLLDRLNTLLYFERRPPDIRRLSFARRIARQTQHVVAAKASPSPFSSTRSLEAVLAFIVVLALTMLVSQVYGPWNRLVDTPAAKAAAQLKPEKAPDLSLPPASSAEQSKTWGEVRITDPGGDLRVTKVDVVPLQIEAAANRPLKQVGWYSAINGGTETPHQLPAPSEPRYAVYQPTVYLDELRLADWDVMTYYAKADTEQERSYASEVYFLEVRPFREDILKMPGGANGKAYQGLSELSSLITRQQHVIRQTHQHLQKPQEQESLQAQDRKKLSDAEGDLGDSAHHLYAQLAAVENMPIGEALDNLAKAENSLNGASVSLVDNIMNEAQNRERRALSELIAARKMFQKAVSDNPSAFADDAKPEENTPTAEAMKKFNAKKLSEMAEFRNEAQAAQQFVDRTVEKQKALEEQVRSGQRSEQPKLAEQQGQLQQELANFQQLHPRPFKGAEAEAQQTQEAMAKAASALQRRGPDSRAATQKATQQAEKLAGALKSGTAGQQLTDAYKLKQMLDKQIQTLGQSANPGSGKPPPDTDVDRAASEARETLNQLKKVAEQKPTRDAFGPPLREALSGPNKADLDSKLARVQLALDEPTRQQRAGEAKEGLSRVSKAFEQSQPEAMQSAQKQDALKPGGQDSFNTGMSQLDGLLKQLQDKRQLSHEDQAKQMREVLENLKAGVQGVPGDDQQAKQLLQKLDAMAKAEQPLSGEDLRKLIGELQSFSVETADQMEKKQDKPQVTNIDPTRLPPAYRGRIQKYFQKLSEK